MQIYLSFSEVQPTLSRENKEKSLLRVSVKQALGGFLVYVNVFADR